LITFDYIYRYDDTKDFQLICLLKKEKYNSLAEEDKRILENKNIELKNIKIKNPNNPVKLIEAVLLVFKV